MSDQKKMAAAMAAVMAYIRDEEDAMMRTLGASPQRPAGQAIANSWGCGGRLDQMQCRQMMQRGLFRPRKGN